jgi:hypothetical protein
MKKIVLILLFISFTLVSCWKNIIENDKSNNENETGIEYKNIDIPKLSEQPNL